MQMRILISALALLFFSSFSTPAHATLLEDIQNWSNLEFEKKLEISRQMISRPSLTWSPNLVDKYTGEIEQLAQQSHVPPYSAEFAFNVYVYMQRYQADFPTPLMDNLSKRGLHPSRGLRIRVDWIAAKDSATDLTQIISSKYGPLRGNLTPIIHAYSASITQIFRNVIANKPQTITEQNAAELAELGFTTNDLLLFPAEQRLKFWTTVTHLKNQFGGLLKPVVEQTLEEIAHTSNAHFLHTKGDLEIALFQAEALGVNLEENAYNQPDRFDDQRVMRTSVYRRVFEEVDTQDYSWSPRRFDPLIHLLASGSTQNPFANAVMRDYLLPYQKAFSHAQLAKLPNKDFAKYMSDKLADQFKSNPNQFSSEGPKVFSYFKTISTEIYDEFTANLIQNLPNQSKNDFNGVYNLDYDYRYLVVKNITPEHIHTIDALLARNYTGSVMEEAYFEALVKAVPLFVNDSTRMEKFQEAFDHYCIARHYGTVTRMFLHSLYQAINELPNGKTEAAHFLGDVENNLRQYAHSRPAEMPETQDTDFNLFEAQLQTPDELIKEEHRNLHPSTRTPMFRLCSDLLKGNANIWSLIKPWPTIDH